MIIIHANPAIKWHTRYAEAFRNGFNRQGIKCTITSNSNYVGTGDYLPVLLGPNCWKRVEQYCDKNNKPYLFVNRKFFGTDPKSIDDVVAISYNGFNGRGYFCVDEVTDDRIKQFADPDFLFKDWQEGKFTILCGQYDAGRCPEDHLERFYTDVRLNAENVKFRPHPRKGKQNDTDLHHARCAAVLNSTVVLDMLCYGIPVVSYDIGSPAFALSSKHISHKLVYPDRLSFFKYLAHCPWHINELIDGSFWLQYKDFDITKEKQLYKYVH